jgi:hypothetical protein
MMVSAPWRSSAEQSGVTTRKGIARWPILNGAVFAISFVNSSAKTVADPDKEAQSISRLTGTTCHAAFQSLLTELSYAELKDVRAEALAATGVRSDKTHRAK